MKCLLKYRRFNECFAGDVQTRRETKMAYPCFICGDSVDERLTINLFLEGPNHIKGEGYNFMISFSPCCDKKACVEAAWEQAKLATIGEVEFSL